MRERVTLSNIKIAVPIKENNIIKCYDIYNLTNTKVVRINSLDQMKVYFGDNSIVLNLITSKTMYGNNIIPANEVVGFIDSPYVLFTNGRVIDRYYGNHNNDDNTYYVYNERESIRLKATHRLNQIYKLYGVNAYIGNNTEQDRVIFEDTITRTSPIYGVCEEDDTRASVVERLIPRVPQDFMRWFTRLNHRHNNTDSRHNTSGEMESQSQSQSHSVDELIGGYHTSDIIHRRLDYHRASNESVDSGSRYFGIELETEMTRGRECEYANAVNEVINGSYENYNKYAKFERDSSLENGCEIITQPMTMEFIMEHKNKIKEILSVINDKGGTSHDNNRCGLHVHVSKASLDSSTIDEIYCLFEFFKPEIIAFSRRTIFRYCNFMDLNVSSGVHLFDKEYFKYHKSTGHCCAINNANNATLEFRIFRGTTRYGTLVASIQLVDNICNIASEFVRGNRSSISWNEVINYNNQYEELKEYNTRKNINSTRVFAGVIDTLARN